MKKIKFLTAIFAVSMCVFSSMVFADTMVNVFYAENDMGNGSWQYDYTFYNTSTNNEYLYGINIYFDNAILNALNTPSGWNDSFSGLIPIDTDYMDIFSMGWNTDIAAGNTLSGLKFSTKTRTANLSYEAFFSDHGNPENTFQLIVAPIATPEPTSLILVLTGLASINLVGYIRKNRGKKN